MKEALSLIDGDSLQQVTPNLPPQVLIPIPVCMPKIWGGEILGEPIAGVPIGETIDMDFRPDAQVRFSDGYGTELLLSEWEQLLNAGDSPEALWGKPTRPRFIIKRIDAKADLSIQLHPNRDEPCESNRPDGPWHRKKDETWFGLSTKPSQLLHGFKAPVPQDVLISALQNADLSQLMRQLHISRGRYIHVPAGTIHAVKKGAYLLEIQDDSQTTFRLDDYGRVDKHGQPRPLHITEGLGHLNLDASTKMPEKIGEDVLTEVIQTQGYHIASTRLEGRVSSCVKTASPLTLTALDVPTRIVVDKFSYKIEPGESLLLTAACRSFNLLSAESVPSPTDPARCIFTYAPGPIPLTLIHV